MKNHYKVRSFEEMHAAVVNLPEGELLHPRFLVDIRQLKASERQAIFTRLQNRPSPQCITPYQQHNDER